MLKSPEVHQELCQEVAQSQIQRQLLDSFSIRFNYRVEDVLPGKPDVVIELTKAGCTKYW